MDHPDVTVLMVWNGPGVDRTKWQLCDILNTIRSKKRAMDNSSNAAANGSKDKRRKVAA